MSNNTMAVEATPPTAGFASRGSNYSAKQARLDKDEKELEELMKGRTNLAEETEEENGTDEEEAEEAPEVKEDAEEDDSNLSREEKSFKKRYGDLRRHMSDKEKEWKEKLEVATTEQSDSIRAPKSDEDIEAWARKYPDVAAIVETIADKKAAARFSAAEGRFKELDEAKYEATRTKAETSIREAHTDFDDLRDADTFHDWVDEQPKWVRDALYENSDDADSVIRVLDLYKVDNGLTPSAKKAKANSLRTATMRSKKQCLPVSSSMTYPVKLANTPILDIKP